MLKEYMGPISHDFEMIIHFGEQVSSSFHLLHFIFPSLIPILYFKYENLIMQYFADSILITVIHNLQLVF